MAGVMGCETGVMPMAYLGMRVGGRINGVAGWAEIVEKVKSKLRKWNVKSLSMGARITLINAVVAAIPIYRLSFATMPGKIAKQLQSIQCSFLWGGDDVLKKIAWLRWDRLCRARRDGGLGIKNLQWFNIALLSKWLWRFMRDKEKLWARIIRSRHDEFEWGREGLFFRRGRPPGAGWWRNIQKTCGGENGRWFWEKLEHVVGNGKQAVFWEGLWFSDNYMITKYPRLYNLCNDKRGTIEQMGQWHDGRWSWDFKWRRQLFDREKVMLEKMIDEIQCVKLIEDVEDTWKWNGGKSGELSVKGAYISIEKMKIPQDTYQRRGECFLRIWKTDAPHKAQAMAWRLLWNRLPTCDNLQKRIGIQPEDIGCKWCGQSVETAEHFFLECKELLNLWNDLVGWIGMRWAAPKSVTIHFLSFSGLLTGKKLRKKLGGLWICTVWVLWKWRNKVVFEKIPWEFNRIVEEIKCRFWSWCNAKGILIQNITYNNWATTPLCSIWCNM